MKIYFVKGSKLANNDFKPVAKEYQKRLQVFFPCETQFLKATDHPLEEADLRRCLEGLGDLQSTFVVCFDDKGQSMSTEQLASRMRVIIDQPQWKRLVLVTGGPFGFSEKAKHLANEKWSLGAGTYPGDLAFIMGLEQVYRSLTVIKGIPYHHQ